MDIFYTNASVDSLPLREIRIGRKNGQFLLSYEFRLKNKKIDSQLRMIKS